MLNVVVSMSTARRLAAGLRSPLLGTLDSSLIVG
jgi:hypothetical protein